MPKKKGKTTPPELDYLFERDIISSGDYIEFWRDYWKAKKQGREQSVIDYYIEVYEQASEETYKKLAGVVTKRKSDAISQAKAINGRVVRRNKRGQFSKRGHFYQAISKPKRK